MTYFYSFSIILQTSIGHQLYIVCYSGCWQCHGEQKVQSPVLKDLIFWFGRKMSNNCEMNINFLLWPLRYHALTSMLPPLLLLHIITSLFGSQLKHQCLLEAFPDHAAPSPFFRYSLLYKVSFFVYNTSREQRSQPFCVCLYPQFLQKCLAQESNEFLMSEGKNECMEGKCYKLWESLSAVTMRIRGQGHTGHVYIWSFSSGQL